MKAKWRILQPATMFFLLTLAIVFLSWICNIYGLSVVQPDTGEELYVQSLLSPEGIRRMLRYLVPNFTGFSPLGLVIVAMLGMGVAQYSGFIDACIRWSIHVCRCRSWQVVAGVIGIGLLSSVVGDAGYILLLPIAAALFQAFGLHPVGGLVAAYVSVACGYSANLFFTAFDMLLSNVTGQVSSTTGLSFGLTGPLCNYYFFAASVPLLLFLIYRITRRFLLPRLGSYQKEEEASASTPLSRRERRAILMACVVGVLYAAVVLWATFSPWGILRGASGNLIHSPFFRGILFLLSFGIGLMGMVYGFFSDRYASDTDVIEGLTQPMKLLSTYVVMVFFASQMFACLEYSHLDRYLAIVGMEWVSSLPLQGWGMLLVFVVAVAVVNLIMVSATAKWAFVSFLFIPVLADMGIAPEVAQCAFRIGDSATNAITPFMFYMPLVLTYMQQYDKRATYLFLLRYTWRYALAILVVWTAFFLLWYALGIPLGL